MSSQQSFWSRNEFSIALIFFAVVYLTSLPMEYLLLRLRLVNVTGLLFVAPLFASGIAARTLLAVIRARESSRGLVREKEILAKYLREASYNINNPLNAIVAHTIALRSELINGRIELQPEIQGSIEQLDLSSRRIAKVINRIAAIDFNNLQEEMPEAGGVIDVEQTGRGLSL